MQDATKSPRALSGRQRNCMSKKQARFLILIILTAGFVSCKKNAFPFAEMQTVALQQCGQKSAGPYICFDSLLTDSRCPLGAECFWSGNALVKITFHEGHDSHTFTMSLKGFPPTGFPSDTTVSGYKISFTDLQPYPQINPRDYLLSKKKASFTISR